MSLVSGQNLRQVAQRESSPMPQVRVPTWQEQARSVLTDLFVDHPRSLGESYWEHQAHATRFGATLVVARVAFLVHGIVPALYPRTASRAVASLYEQMIGMRRLSPS